MTPGAVKGDGTPKQGERTPEKTGASPGSKTRRSQEGQGRGMDRPREEDGSPNQTEARSLQTDRIENKRQKQIEKEEERDQKWATPYGDKKGDQERHEKHLVKIMTYNVGSFPKIGMVKQ